MFVIMGDLNADPFDGDSTAEAALQILEHARIDAAIAGGVDRIGLEDPPKRIDHDGEAVADDDDVADDQGRVHVVARGTGMVISIDPKAGTILERRAVCQNPRGIAYQAELDSLHVACAGGQLVSLRPEGGAPWRCSCVLCLAL